MQNLSMPILHTSEGKRESAKGTVIQHEAKTPPHTSSQWNPNFYRISLYSNSYDGSIKHLLVILTPTTVAHEFIKLYIKITVHYGLEHNKGSFFCTLHCKEETVLLSQIACWQS